MAKKDEFRPAKSKMTVMVFQLEGSDDTIQEGLRKISQAVENTFQGHRAQRVLLPPKGSEEGPSDVPDASIQMGADEQESANGLVEAQDGAEESKARARKAERSPDIVEIDRSKASVSLAEFFERKLPGESSQRDQVLVIGYWLKHQAKVPEFTVDHVYTLMRELGKSMGTYPRQLLRNLKATRYLSGGSETGIYTINSVSETVVDKLQAK